MFLKMNWAEFVRVLTVQPFEVITHTHSTVAQPTRTYRHAAAVCCLGQPPFDRLPPPPAVWPLCIDSVVWNRYTGSMELNSFCRSPLLTRPPSLVDRVQQGDKARLPPRHFERDRASPSTKDFDWCDWKKFSAVLLFFGALHVRQTRRAARFHE
jgi:hypothetical protein